MEQKNQNDKNITEKFGKATKWSAITEIVSKLTIPLSNMVLARIISPEAFGVVATVTMIMSFADMFTDAGFQKYIVQKEFESEEKKFKSINVAFLTNLSISIFLFLIILIFREKIAVLVGNPGLGNVIAIACIQLFLTSFSSIQMALYRREFNFKTLFYVRIVTVFIPFVITIPLALLGLSYWSIIIGLIITQFSNAIILTIKSKWKPNLYFNLSVLKEMISFSLWSLVEAISIWFTVWIDVFIISTSLTQYYVGIYKTSTMMVNVLLSLITASVVPALFSALSRLQNDDNKFKELYYSVQRLVAILVFPIGVGVYIYSDLATKILLGNNWNEASNVIGIWALTGAITIVFAHFCSEVYRAKGKTKLSFLVQVLHLIVLVPVCIISSRYDFWTLVYARSWIRMELVLVNLIMMRYVLKFYIFKSFINVYPAIIASVVMGIFGYVFNLLGETILWNIISIFICVILYFGVLYLFPDMRKGIKYLLTKFKILRLNRT